MAATTTRLPDGLKEEGERYADGLGISLNALLAVALRDYLDRRRTPKSVAPSGALPQTPAPIQPPALAVNRVSQASQAAYQAPKSRSAPCPCGAVDGDGHRLKWKHCHGRPPGT